MLLREVLVTLTNISIATINTLIDISKGKGITTQTVNNEISRLKASVEATTSLVSFYEQKLQQEVETEAMGRHMEDARVLTNAIRTMRRNEQTAMSQPGFQHDTATASREPNDDFARTSNTVTESSDLSPNPLKILQRQTDTNVGIITSYRKSASNQLQSRHGAPSLHNPVVDHLRHDHTARATFATAVQHPSSKNLDQIQAKGVFQLRRTKSTTLGQAAKARLGEGRDATPYRKRLPSVEGGFSLTGSSGRCERAS